ncbi:histidine triad nucleotide-binding protein [Helicobacter kayseriensis]|uniref:histidine triad nucleotide-binding protein n=1 Tax=Helicobacter kayseriensis TaxID=2905877 RepID=UPI001E4F252C|nr:histidine triad nucleotide-binding protein [Helicobacter kayseriensis]MCE3047713.1 histidine triad nucleotide-binding protein [Helicobacter kayseriensis]MCE3049049.1 histidine triad nucleotide-binding protein [Helicobacter kayseriensis]
MSSIFTKIINGEIPSNKVLENQTCIAIHDISPQAPIHILIIPKKEIKDFQELDLQTMNELMMFIQEVAQKLGLDQSGYRLITNVGKDGGQEIPHLHFHLLGGAKLKWEKLA